MRSSSEVEVTPDVPPLYEQKIAAGQEHTCALKNANQNGGSGVLCWGKNRFGQLGVGGSLAVEVVNGALDVVDVGESLNGAALTGVTQVSLGLMHTCALKSDNTVVCWGTQEIVGSWGMAPTHTRHSPSCCGLKWDWNTIQCETNSLRKQS